MVTASEAREPDVYRDCSNRLLEMPLPSSHFLFEGLQKRFSLRTEGIAEEVLDQEDRSHSPKDRPEVRNPPELSQQIGLRSG